MAWEKFTKLGCRSKPFLSVRTSGQIGISGAAIRKYDIKSGHVILFYDVKQSLIGIEMNSSENEIGAVQLKIINDAGVINIKSLLQYYDVDFSVNRKYAIRKDKATGYLVSNFEEPICPI